MNRRAFFRSCRTAVVGGIAIVVGAAVGLPALPKRHTWRKLYGIPAPRWRPLNTQRMLTLVDVAKLNNQYNEMKEKAFVSVLNDEILQDIPWKEETR